MKIVVVYSFSINTMSESTRQANGSDVVYLDQIQKQFLFPTSPVNDFTYSFKTILTLICSS